MAISKFNLVGRKFGRWTVLRQTTERVGRPTFWRCRCACGVERDVRQTGLSDGISKSCGCLKRELAAKRMRTHGSGGRGELRTPEYHAWRAMIDRCDSRRALEFPNHAGRGITVYPPWRHDFAAFLAAVGLKPSAKHSLDRYPDNNGHYEPGNVRWATVDQQVANRRGCTCPHCEYHQRLNAVRASGRA